MQEWLLRRYLTIRASMPNAMSAVRAEHFDHTVSEEELQGGQICDAAIVFAINLWRSGEEDYANATPPEYKA